MDQADEDALRRRVKAELRKRMRGLRMAMPASACAERSAKIVAALGAIDEVKSARSVALFWPIVDRHEVDVRALDVALRERGTQVAYPAIHPDTRVMSFHWAHEKDLEERGLGFSEPPVESPQATELDVIVVPALAIDPRGHRLGYGAGFYDRTLPLFPKATTIAVAFDFQVLAELGVTDHDVPVNRVVTDARSFRVEADADR